MSQAEFTRTRKRARAAKPSPAVAGPSIAVRPSCQVTTAMRDRKLGGVGAREQVPRSDGVQELRLTHPAAPPHDLFPHERDMRGRSAEAQGPQLEKELREFTQLGDSDLDEYLAGQIDPTQRPKGQKVAELAPAACEMYVLTPIFRHGSNLIWGLVVCLR
jgi:hypothetical protein